MTGVVPLIASRSPQVADGHVRIANELYDAIVAFPFTLHQFKVVMAVVRKTYGYGKKVDDVSASQLGALCRLPRSHVSVALSQLAALKVISKAPGQYGLIIGLNKDYSSWIDPSSAKDDGVSGKSARALDAADLKKYHYLYKIVCIDSGDFYIGVRSCNCLPAQDRYMGSGNWPTSVDKTRLRKEVLETFDSRKAAEASEVKAIQAGGTRLKNVRLYAATDSVLPRTESVRGSTEPVHVQNLYAASTDSVQVDSTDSVHTITNLPITNTNIETAIAVSSGEQLALSPDDSGQAPPPIVSLPLNDGSEHTAEHQKVAEWSAAFPAVDLPGEFRRMRVWLDANKPERKTRRGINRFIVLWLGKAQRDATNPPGVVHSRRAVSAGASNHGNLSTQDYHVGVAADGSF